MFFAKEVGGRIIERYMRVIDFDGIGNLCLFLQVCVDVGDKRFLDYLMLPSHATGM